VNADQMAAVCAAGCQADALPEFYFAKIDSGTEVMAS